MRVWTFRVLPVIVLLAASIVSSHVASAGTRPYPKGRAVLDQRMQGLLYLADHERNQIDVFQAGVPSPQQLGTITQGVDSPVDIAVDTNDTLYVANDGPIPGTVSVFPAGSSIPSETITLPAKAFVHHIGVGPHGTIYVATSDNAAHYFIVEYDPGELSPSRIVHLPFYNDPCCATVQGIAFDSSDNMYVNYGEGYACCGYGILVYAPHALHATSGFYVGYGLAFGAIEIDADDDLFIGGERVIRVAHIPNHHGYFRSIPTPMSSNLNLALEAKTGYLYTFAVGGVQAYDSSSGKRIGSPFAADISDEGGIAVYPPAY